MTKLWSHSTTGSQKRYTFKRVLNVPISKTSVATLPETRKMKILNMCISGQTAEAHGKNRMCPLVCQVKKGSYSNSRQNHFGAIASTIQEVAENRLFVVQLWLRHWVRLQMRCSHHDFRTCSSELFVTLITACVVLCVILSIVQTYIIVSYRSCVNAVTCSYIYSILYYQHINENLLQVIKYRISNDWLPHKLNWSTQARRCTFSIKQGWSLKPDFHAATTAFVM